MSLKHAHILPELTCRLFFRDRISSLSVIAIVGTCRLCLVLQTIDVDDDVDKHDNSVCQEHVPRFRPDVITW